MPTKKSPKKACCSSDDLQVKMDKIKDEIKLVSTQVSSLLKEAKNKYDQADPKTKQKVVAGLAGAAALIAGAIGLAAAKKKK